MSTLSLPDDLQNQLNNCTNRDELTQVIYLFVDKAQPQLITEELIERHYSLQSSNDTFRIATSCIVAAIIKQLGNNEHLSAASIAAIKAILTCHKTHKVPFDHGNLVQKTIKTVVFTDKAITENLKKAFRDILPNFKFTTPPAPAPTPQAAAWLAAVSTQRVMVSLVALCGITALCYYSYLAHQAAAKVAHEERDDSHDLTIPIS